MPDVSLHPEKEPAHWAFGVFIVFFPPSFSFFLLFSFFITLKCKHFRALGMLGSMS